MAGTDCIKPAGSSAAGVSGVGGRDDSNTLESMPAVDAQPFRFFDLPRETRNEIYGLCANDENAVDFNDRWIFSSSTTGSTSLLLVSREFKDEYEQEVYRDAEARLTIAVGIELEGLYSFPLPRERLRFCGHVKHLTLELTGWIHGLGKDLRLEYTLEAFFREITTVLFPRMLPNFPVVRSLKLVFTTELKYMKVTLEGDDFPLSTFFDTDLAPVGQDQPIVFTKELLLLDNLYEVRWKAPDIKKWTFNDLRGHVVYRATIATSEPSWCGLDLATASCSEFMWAWFPPDHDSEKYDCPCSFCTPQIDGI